MRGSTKRRLFAGALLGALILFLWGGFSHLVLFVGVGFRTLPDESRVMGALASSIPADGLYFFPGTDLRGEQTPEERLSFEAKYRAGPTGLLLYHPLGGEPVSPRKLATQFLSHLLAAVLAAWLASQLCASYVRRVLAIASLGVVSWLTVSLIYWNWYGFPSAFFLAQGADQVIGWLLAGLAIARIVAPAELPIRAESPPDACGRLPSGAA